VRRELFLSELTPGSYVVHVDHGVGRFVGTRQVEAEHGAKEFLTLEYAEGDRLYVPPEHLDRLSPYVAPGESPPSLTRLGTQEWSRAKDRARRSAQEMAQELLTLHAARQVLPGFAFSPDTPWQRELEEAFPYQETPDQQQALSEVKADMEEPHPLDRLVCGDVGYGKTEIALRAAFKAIQDGKQVALLCPTTILAQQHYATFTERLAPFPVRVEVLSRFRTDEEQRQVVEGLRSGAVDLVIGTHRLVQKDVAFKDLGLLVIDDEQRFGVAHKERFKQLRQEVDVLTMTATPIPRTLYMAMSGIRDISTIETPPETRQPVRTFVASYSDDLVREAVLRELDRGGQTFFLHNRVRDIAEWAARLQELAPQARVAIGHGQMDEAELAAVMADFGQGKIDVLVCTTIIEAGLDLPNANTLIVHRPELLGLAQMHQLRGRVGRGTQRAYAYLLTPRGRRITEAAEKRLQAMLAHQELGSGFRIAMKDLEIRGAGNLLGAEQSGHIHAIGFDLYVRLLEEAVDDLRQQTGDGPRPQPPPPVTVSLPLEAQIPEEYVSDLTQRLGVYQRLARTTALEEVEALVVELRDRFGPVPEPVVNLFYIVRVRLLAGAAGVESLAREGDHIALRLREPTGGARPALQAELGPVAQVGDRLIRLRMGADWLQELAGTLEGLGAFRQRLLALAGE
jgi:transcription-repair coupling factor (superfamily II helicase)